MSRWLYPFERRLLLRRRLVLGAVIAAAFLLLLLLDRPTFHALFVGEDRLQSLEGQDWYRAFRIIGTLWTWIFLSAALAAHGLWLRRRSGRRGAEEPLFTAAILILVSALTSGLVVEILQVLTGRVRPRITEGDHVFRGIFRRFVDSEGLGFPSSHAAVAFGAAFMMCFLWPAPGLVTLVAAALCGLTRLLSGAHFLTDVFGAALVGYAMARLLRPGSWRGLQRGLILP